MKFILRLVILDQLLLVTGSGTVPRSQSASRLYRNSLTKRVRSCINAGIYFVFLQPVQLPQIDPAKCYPTFKLSGQPGPPFSASPSRTSITSLHQNIHYQLQLNHAGTRNSKVSACAKTSLPSLYELSRQKSPLRCCPKPTKVYQLCA